MSRFKLINNVLKITTGSIEKSPTYREPEYKPLALESAHVVERGTQEGSPTVDLVLVDENGQKYVAMTTGKLIEILTSSISATRVRTNLI